MDLAALCKPPQRFPLRTNRSLGRLTNSVSDGKEAAKLVHNRHHCVSHVPMLNGDMQD